MTTPTHIKTFKVKRSGAGLALHYVDDAGKPGKITGLSLVEIIHRDFVTITDQADGQKRSVALA